MSQKTFSNLAKMIIILFAVLGVAFYGAAVPFFGLDLKNTYPEFGYCFVPWLVFIEVMLVPDYIVLVFAWQVSRTIERGSAFCFDNAKRLKIVSILALVTSVYFFLGNITFLFLGMNHPSIFLVSFVLVFIGMAISAAAAILSYLVRKAANLQEESELTI